MESQPESKGADAQALPESARVPAGWLPDGAEALFGEGARAEESYGLLTVDVPPGSWISALETARDGLGCRFFDWLSAVDEPGTGFRVYAHVVALPGGSGPEPRDRGPDAADEARTESAEEARSEGRTEAPEAGLDERGPAGPPSGGAVRRLLLRTTVPHEAPVLPTATAVFAGAAWHERETHEMFGVDFSGHPGLTPLLLPDSFEGHPLRKDFVLAARVAKAWPGAVEPGESSHGAPKRRQMLPPGVPDPNEWGPLKGQLPPVPSRPARGRAGRAGAAERPARRARSASAGSASQRGDAEAAEQRPGGERAAEREREREQSPQTPEQPPGQERTAPGGGAGRRRPSDAPWHDGGERSGNTGSGNPESGKGGSGEGVSEESGSRTTDSGRGGAGGEGSDPGAEGSDSGGEGSDSGGEGSDSGGEGSGPRPPKGGA
ncbi:NADH-quinone oxidoreductase subunit C [Streptomyces marispadix]|uniref:NADH-quinone oxidoreductase subunit C n=1 Tax=Streptomyces marispadix TaxID=2922868 RepID=A0ABS9T0D3_9ACTN|nr:NADH-quinone oxidoreductase subunit C [Streptomyces marispadix]MCH6161996.1 NADH-quinone oxidoreductase subunit C [Streptomyces marispadix]